MQKEVDVAKRKKRKPRAAKALGRPFQDKMVRTPPVNKGVQPNSQGA